MPKHLLSFVLITLWLHATALTLPAYAALPADAQAQQAAQIKQAVGKLASGRDARVRVTLRDGKKLAGVIQEIRDADFVVTEAGTGNAIEVAYQGRAGYWLICRSNPRPASMSAPTRRCSVLRWRFRC